MRSFARMAIAGSRVVSGGGPFYQSIWSGRNGGVYTSWDSGSLFTNQGGTTPATANGNAVLNWTPVAGNVGAMNAASSPFTLQGVGTAPYVSSAGTSGSLVTSTMPAVGTSTDFSVIVAFTGTASDLFDLFCVTGNFAIYWGGTNTLVFEGVSPDFFNVSITVPTSGSVVAQYRRTGGSQLAGRTGTGAGGWTNGNTTTEAFADANSDISITRNSFQTAASSHFAILAIDRLLTDTEFSDIRTEFLAQMP